MIDPRSLAGLIVSCQAPKGSPLRDTSIMMAMALAAERRGATAVRAEGADDVAAMTARLVIPVIGIRKHARPGSEVYITATRDDIDLLYAAGARIIALDATPRTRPDGETLEVVIAHARALDITVMADLSASDEAPRARDAGAHILATTLVPASSEDHRQGGPNIRVIKRIAAHDLGLPIIAEGRFATPHDLQLATSAGASAVVIGRALTDTDAIIADAVGAMREAMSG